MDFLGSVEQTIAVCAAVITLVSSTVTFVAKFIKANKARAVEFKKATTARKAQMLMEVCNGIGAGRRNNQKHKK